AGEPPRRDRETAPMLAGYTSGELLGRGGMGEVVLAHDQRIGRQVAIKRMRSASPSDIALSRFLREARIQARLEHPAIVPVYELGNASDGTPFFAMKRLAGVTLTDVMQKPDGRDVRVQLRALVDVCLAIEFAHSRGIVHRDLKPSNIMLGDFGEVYVLDWGIARVLDESERIAVSDLDSEDGETQAGSLLGTPGYMAPEQIQSSEVGPRADVYALGAILFEILVGQPLHPGGTEGLVTTVTKPECAPSERRPDGSIAPELDAICLAALSEDFMKRPTARQLGDEIQRYLDGDRDIARRRELAAASVTRARDALASEDPNRRAEAMAAAGRALALDPESPDAAAVVGALMLEAPKKLPPELVDQLREGDIELDVRAARSTTFAMLAFLLFMPMLAFTGVKSWPLIGTLIGLVVGLAALSAMMVRTRRSHLWVFMFGFSAFMVLLSQLWSPFILIPGILGVSSASLIAQPDFVDRPWVPLGVALSAWLTPFGLEALGVFSSTWSFAGDTLEIRSGALPLDGAMITAMLVLGNVGLIVVNGFYAHALASTRRDASRRQEIQSWHLSKLLPTR
ncbi:MAG: serine/threonine protein kinase, partial [Deltaproteobacteria bacterium]|nr:serine/threonine protein kinase [Deltaproteobacteria bacterium]